MALALAGVGGWWWSRPTTEARCAQVSAPARREACLREVWLRDAQTPEAIAAAVAASEDPVTRDLLRLRLVAGEPVQAGLICPQVEGARAQRLCRLLEGRTHLWEAPPREPGRGGKGAEGAPR